jgi:hypothetical protein
MVLPGAGLRPPSSYLCLPYAWDYRNVLYTTPSLFFDMGVLLTFCLGWPQTEILLISASQVAGIIDIYHYAWLVFFL